MQVELIGDQGQFKRIIDDGWGLQTILKALHDQQADQTFDLLETALSEFPPPLEGPLPFTAKATWRKGVLIQPGDLVKFWTDDPEGYNPDQPNGIGSFVQAIQRADGFLDAFVDYEGETILAYKVELAPNPNALLFRQAQAKEIARLLQAAKKYPSSKWTCKICKICQFYKTESGCRKGSNCKFLHE